ncbi:MAG: RIP metalloprotease [Anaerolineae bacterium]|nr:MAG: RIP metalloprotease [Anaerolineae bacterium]
MLSNETVQLVVALSALILVHELGHFIAARLVRVRVEEFGLGYPPRALTLFERNGTRYTLNWLPLGGFVRLKGEMEEDGDPDSLHSANPWARLLIFLAGPVMNLLAAAALYAMIFLQIGAPDVQRVLVTETDPGSPAETAGLLPGDIITAVNDQPVRGMNDLHDKIYAHLGVPITLTVQREAETLQFELVPRENPPEGEGAIGIAMSNPLIPVGLHQAIPLGFVATYGSAQMLLSLPGDILAGRIAPEAARPVGLKGMRDALKYANQLELPEEAADAPFNVNVLGFFAWISVTLGIVNLLPIPALDGGRIALLLPEIVLRRRIPLKWQNAVIAITFAALVALMVYINLLDFIDPLTLPQ